MTNSKNTKRALLTSAFAILLCFVMLIGTTFAWFTDSASTGVNKIQAGTLDVELQMKDASGNWVNAEGQALEFVKAADAPAGEKILWEPGCTYELPAVYVKNNGNLALKYKIQITGINGDAKLNEAIDWTINGLSLDTEGHLTAGATSDALTIKGHMKEDAGNEYQGLSIDGIAITVVATQDTVEYDSNNNQYDKNAQYATVSTSNELTTAIAKGEDVVLNADITLSAPLDVTSSVTIHGNGYTLKTSTGTRVINVNSNSEPVTLTLSNVKIDASELERGITVGGNTADITIVMDNCTCIADHYALNIAVGNDGTVNVIVRNTTLTGYTAFQTFTANTNATFENCTLVGLNKWSDSSDDFATIVVNEGASSSNLTFKNCRIEANETGTANEYLLSVRETGVTATFEGCEFFVNDTEVTGDTITDNMELNGNSAPTIK